MNSEELIIQPYLEDKNIKSAKITTHKNIFFIRDGDASILRKNTMSKIHIMSMRSMKTQKTIWNQSYFLHLAA